MSTEAVFIDAVKWALTQGKPKGTPALREALAKGLLKNVPWAVEEGLVQSEDFRDVEARLADTESLLIHARRLKEHLGARDCYRLGARTLHLGYLTESSERVERELVRIAEGLRFVRRKEPYRGGGDPSFRSLQRHVVFVAAWHYEKVLEIAPSPTEGPFSRVLDTIHNHFLVPVLRKSETCVFGRDLKEQAIADARHWLHVEIEAEKEGTRLRGYPQPPHPYHLPWDAPCP